MNSYLIQKIHTLEDRINAKFEREKEELKKMNEMQSKEAQHLDQILKEKELKNEKQFRELKQMIGDLKSDMNVWSSQTIFFRLIFELQIYQKAVLDQRFCERVVREKLSDLCIFCVARMPDGKIIVDANKRPTIIDENNFEILQQLDPNDSQLVNIGFQKDKMLAHF